MEISMQVWVIAGLVVLTTIFVMLILTRMYRIVGPNDGARRGRAFAGCAR